MRDREVKIGVLNKVIEVTTETCTEIIQNLGLLQYVDQNSQEEEEVKEENEEKLIRLANKMKDLTLEGNITSTKSQNNNP